MSDAIEFSIMADEVGVIQPLLDQFTAATGHAVHVRLLNWDTAWNDLMKWALYSDGPDVSEIGSTWLGDLGAMQALRPFTDDEVAQLGGPAAFQPSAWQGCHLAGKPTAWAIPWLVGTRLLFFRRRLLDRAGIDPQTAFQTAARLDQALAHLHEAGVSVPWTVPTGVTHTTLLNAASWIWGAGGDILTADGRRTLFNQAASRAGLRAYFALGRYLAPGMRHTRAIQTDDQFRHNPDTALTLSGPWMFALLGPEHADDGSDPVGVAQPPGPALVGGSHLVIWKHSRHEAAALDLIRFLMEPEAQIIYSQRAGLLPARLDAQAAPPFAHDPRWQEEIRGAQAGRTFPVTRSWGLVEYRLASTFGNLWSESLAQPTGDLDALLRKYLEPLAQRLDQLLSQA